MATGLLWVSLCKALLVACLMPPATSWSLNKALLSMAFLEPAQGGLKWWRVREYKGKRYYLSLKGKWFPLDEEDEESLDKAIQDDWTLGAYIAGESAVCAWEDEWEVDEAPPYWHPENRRWVRAFPNMEGYGWEQATELPGPEQGMQDTWWSAGPEQGQSSSSASGSWSSWGPEPGQGWWEPAQGWQRGWAASWWDGGKQSWYREQWYAPPTPQSHTPTEPASPNTEPEQGSPDDVPLTPDRWCMRGKQADANRLARRKLQREGKPVPPELMPKKVDMKAIKKEMKLLVDMAREAYLSAGGTPKEKRQRPEQGKNERTRSKGPGKGHGKRTRSKSQGPRNKGTPRTLPKENLGQPGKGSNASSQSYSYSPTEEPSAPPEPEQGKEQTSAGPEQGQETTAQSSSGPEQGQETTAQSSAGPEQGQKTKEEEDEELEGEEEEEGEEKDKKKRKEKPFFDA